MGLYDEIDFEKHRYLLTKHIYPFVFYDVLRSHCILSQSDVETIECKQLYPTRRLRAGCFLDIITTKGPEGFEKFMEILGWEYDFIYKEIVGTDPPVAPKGYKHSKHSRISTLIPQLMVLADNLKREHDQKNQLSAQLDELKKVMEYSEREKDEMEQQIEGYRRLESAHEKIKKYLIDIKQKSDFHIEEINKYLLQILELKNDKDTYLKNNCLLFSENKDLQSANRNLSEELSKLRSQMKIREEPEEKEKIMEDWNLKENDVKFAPTSQLAKRYNEHETQVCKEIFQDEIMNLQQKNTELSEYIYKLQQENSNLECKYKQAKDYIQKMNLEKKTMEEELKSLKKKNEQYCGIIQEIKEGKTRATNEIGKIQKEYYEILSRNNEHVQRIFSLEEELFVLKHELIKYSRHSQSCCADSLAMTYRMINSEVVENCSDNLPVNTPNIGLCQTNDLSGEGIGNLDRNCHGEGYRFMMTTQMKFRSRSDTMECNPSTSLKKRNFKDSEECMLSSFPYSLYADDFGILNSSSGDIDKISATSGCPDDSLQSQHCFSTDDENQINLFNKVMELFPDKPVLSTGQTKQVVSLSQDRLQTFLKEVELEGGYHTGFFIKNLPASVNLKCGDQIIKISYLTNECEKNCELSGRMPMVKKLFQTCLEDNPQKAWLHVISCPENYQLAKTWMKTNQSSGDFFYIRCNFSWKPDVENGLRFEENDILLVTDMQPNDMYWLGAKVCMKTGTRDPKADGLIPNVKHARNIWKDEVEHRHLDSSTKSYKDCSHCEGNSSTLSRRRVVRGDRSQLFPYLEVNPAKAAKSFPIMLFGVDELVSAILKLLEKEAIFKFQHSALNQVNQASVKGLLTEEGYGTLKGNLEMLKNCKSTPVPVYAIILQLNQSDLSTNNNSRASSEECDSINMRSSHSEINLEVQLKKLQVNYEIIYFSSMELPPNFIELFRKTLAKLQSHLFWIGNSLSNI